MREPSNRKSVIDIILAIVFVVLGLGVAADAIYLQISFRAHVECNGRLIEVLQDQEQARAIVDKSTTDAQDALIVVFDEVLANDNPALIRPDDPEILLARQKFYQAALDRRQLVSVLAEPYPDCH